jgi:hypothetical protein
MSSCYATTSSLQIKSRYFFIRDKIANGNLEDIYCSTEMMWANVLTKPKQGGPLRLNCSHVMNIPINYDDNIKRTKTHPLLLPQDERPKLSPKQMND